MQKKSAGSENSLGVEGNTKDGATKIWGQLVVGLLRNFKIRIVGGWLSLVFFDTTHCQEMHQRKPRWKTTRGDVEAAKLRRFCSWWAVSQQPQHGIG